MVATTDAFEVMSIASAMRNVVDLNGYLVQQGRDSSIRMSDAEIYALFERVDAHIEKDLDGFSEEGLHIWEAYCDVGDDGEYTPVVVLSEICSQAREMRELMSRTLELAQAGAVSASIDGSLGMDPVTWDMKNLVGLGFASSQTAMDINLDASSAQAGATPTAK